MISKKGVINPAISNDLSICAPLFAQRVKAAINEANEVGYDIMLYEAERTEETQAAYYALGRTVIPPKETVTNAAHAIGSWHFYGLAGDFISKAKRWEVPLSWMEKVAEIFKKHGLDWGGDWEHPDYPHYQFSGLHKSPTDRAIELYNQGGREAVWKEVGAMDNAT